MSKSLLTGAALLLTLAACATVSPTSEVARAAASLAPPAPAVAPGCVGATASRIPMKPGECGGFGRTYDRDDFQRTGENRVGAALEVLDPALTVRGH